MSSKKFSVVFVLLYKGQIELLLEPTSGAFSVCLIALNNLDKIFGCSIITDFVFFSLEIRITLQELQEFFWHYKDQASFSVDLGVSKQTSFF